MPRRLRHAGASIAVITRSARAAYRPGYGFQGVRAQCMTILSITPISNVSLPRPMQLTVQRRPLGPRAARSRHWHFAIERRQAPATTASLAPHHATPDRHPHDNYPDARRDPHPRCCDCGEVMQMLQTVQEERWPDAVILVYRARTGTRTRCSAGESGRLLEDASDPAGFRKHKKVPAQTGAEGARRRAARQKQNPPGRSRAG